MNPRYVNLCLLRSQRKLHDVYEINQPSLLPATILSNYSNLLLFLVYAVDYGLLGFFVVLFVFLVLFFRFILSSHVVDLYHAVPSQNIVLTHPVVVDEPVVAANKMGYRKKVKIRPNFKINCFAGLPDHTSPLSIVVAEFEGFFFSSS